MESEIWAKVACWKVYSSWFSCTFCSFKLHTTLRWPECKFCIALNRDRSQHDLYKMTLYIPTIYIEATSAVRLTCKLDMDILDSRRTQGKQNQFQVQYFRIWLLTEKKFVGNVIILIKNVFKSCKRTLEMYFLHSNS